jgi:hypothetical protein
VKELSDFNTQPSTLNLLKRDAKRLVPLGQLVAVNGSQLMLQRGRGGETVRNCVGVGKGIDFNGLDQCDANVANARDVAPLPGPHVAEFPQPDRLRFLAGANRGQEFLFEEEHNDRRLVAEEAGQ